MSLTAADFESLHSQLVALKTQLYEAKEKETRAIQQRDVALAQIHQHQQQNASNASIANSSFHGINEDGTTDGPPMTAATAAPPQPQPSSQQAAAPSTPSKFDSLLNSVKRNSTSLSSVLSNAANGGNPQEKSAANTLALQQQIDALNLQLSQTRTQATNDLDEAREQQTALKMSISHLHKKTQELEKQNGALMKHLADLEEERLSLAMRREEEMKKAKGGDDVPSSTASASASPENDEDVTQVKTRLQARIIALESELSKALSDASAKAESDSTLARERDTTISKLTLQLEGERVERERALTVVKEREQDLENLRAELAEARKLGLAAATGGASAAAAAAAAASSSSSSTDSTPTSPSSNPDEPPPPWSADLPLADQVTSLQHELATSRTMLEHLLGSISKKDSSIRTIQDDCERVMKKLAEKEMEIHALREGNSREEALLRELKKKENEIATLQTKLKTAASSSSSNSSSGSSTLSTLPSNAPTLDSNISSTSSAAAQMELRAATDAIANMQSEYESLKETLENTKDLLFLAETQLIDKQKILGEQSDTIKELRDACDLHERNLNNICQQKSKLETELNEHIDYLEKKCLSEVSEWERKYDEDLGKLKEELNQFIQVKKEAENELQVALNKEREVRNELDAVNAELAAASEREAGIQGELTRLQAQLHDISSSSHIETRKRNHLVNELKNLLKSELISKKELEARLKHAQDEITTLRIMNQHQIGRESSGTGLSVDTNDAAGGADASKLNGNGTSANSTVPSTPHAKGVEAEVTLALAQKLESLQNERHILLKKKNALEEHCELLTADLSQKKEIIRNLVRRIETGALPAAADSARMFASGSDKLTPEAREQLFEKIEIILHETVLQNTQYKTNLGSMGQEITKLMAELEEARNELTELREEVETLRDESELAEAAASDSAALLRTTEARISKLERAVVSLSTGADVDEELSAFIRQVVSAPSKTPRISMTPSTVPGTPIHPQSAAAKRPAHHVPQKSPSTAAAAAAIASAATPSAASLAAEDARINELENEARAASAARDEERKQAQKKEQDRRDQLMKEADDLAAMYSAASPTNVGRANAVQRSVSEVLAEPDLDEQE